MSRAPAKSKKSATKASKLSLADTLHLELRRGAGFFFSSGAVPGENPVRLAKQQRAYLIQTPPANHLPC